MKVIWKKIVNHYLLLYLSVSLILTIGLTFTVINYSKKAEAAFTFVQVDATGAAASGTTIALAQSSNPTTGNLIVVFVEGTAAVTTSPTVADTLNNTYTEITAAKVVYGYYNVNTVFYAYNVTGGSANTITVTFPGATTGRSITIVEYSGLATATNPLDAAIGQAQASPGTGTDILTSTTLTVAEANELLIGYTININMSFCSITVSSGFTQRYNAHPNYTQQRVIEDKLPSTGLNAATFTLNDSGTDVYVTQAVAFKPPAGAPDTTPPVISSVASSGITSSAAAITWTTNEASDTQIEYGTTTSYGSSTTLNTSLVTSHSQALSGLSSNTLYHYRVKSKDAAGNLATSGDYTFTTTTTVPADTTPPVISAISASAVAAFTATINWTTNELSDSQVEYGLTTGYGSQTTLNTSLVISHSQPLSGLTASTLYHYKVKSKDASANLATSGDNTLTTSAAPSSSNIYISQSGAGGQDGSSCSNAYAASFFNTASNWGSGAGQIGSDTTIHLCGTFSGGNAATLLTFQAGGTSGHPVTLLFETGAVVQADYCAGTGCINLNGNSHIVINGGTTCGETSHWSTTACNGLIQNTLAGSSGATCPAGTCTKQLVGTRSTGIGSTGNPVDIEIKNLTIGPIFVKLPESSQAGGDTYGVLIGGQGNTATASNIRVHNCILKQVYKTVVVSFGSPGFLTTVSGFEYYNNNSSDQCWAHGVGAATENLIIQGISFHDNEVSNWDNWAHDIADCHPNGTMYFNGDGGTIFTTGRIGDSTSLIYNNYLHGDLTGGILASSASGFISCQDNCIDVAVFNNTIYDTCTGASPSRACGGIIYFNGTGGGGQRVYNNTIVASHGNNCFSVISVTAPVLIKNNICSGGANNIYAMRSGTAWADYYTGDFNDIYNLTSPNNWVCNSSATCTNRAGAAPNDANSITTNPNLDANYKLQSGSAAIGLGTNLTSLGITALNSDATGAARPASGAWDAGAYQYSSVPPDFTAPSAPTGVTVQ